MPANPTVDLAPEEGFHTIPLLIRLHAAAAPAHAALVQDGTVPDNAQPDALMDRVAAALQRDGIRPGEAIANCAPA